MPLWLNFRVSCFYTFVYYLPLLISPNLLNIRSHFILIFISKNLRPPLEWFHINNVCTYVPDILDMPNSTKPKKCRSWTFFSTADQRRRTICPSNSPILLCLQNLKAIDLYRKIPRNHISGAKKTKKNILYWLSTVCVGHACVQNYSSTEFYKSCTLISSHVILLFSLISI